MQQYTSFAGGKIHRWTALGNWSFGGMDEPIAPTKPNQSGRVVNRRQIESVDSNNPSKGPIEGEVANCPYPTKKSA